MKVIVVAAIWGHIFNSQIGDLALLKKTDQILIQINYFTNYQKDESLALDQNWDRWTYGSKNFTPPAEGYNKATDLNENPTVQLWS